MTGAATNAAHWEAAVAELIPADFGLLVSRAFTELERDKQCFDLPARKFYRAKPGIDLGVRFHGQSASNAVGPAAGPQTQLIQNIVLAWLAGARIFELKTIQINDQLQIPRPCIDATNVGYNVEWSQELRLEQSLREYVGAHMLLEMLRDSGVVDADHEDETFAQSEWIFDFSVGYDLKGIRNPRVVHFMRSCMNARDVVAELREKIPKRYRGLRDLDFEEHLVRSVTLSTFHGCPADEIEGICEFLLREMGLHVTIKLNPTLLGVERCEHLLRDVLGYEDVRVAREHFDNDLRFEQMVPMVQRLQRTAEECNLGLGVKLTNTLVVHNHKEYFSDDVMYLSGAPLHVLTMNILSDVRDALGPKLPISFSAGVDARNFARALSCRLTPITTCTDLLRPGGYGRLPAYLQNAESEMERLKVRNVGDFILRAENKGPEAARTAIDELGEAVRRAASTSVLKQPDRRDVLDHFVEALHRRAREAIDGSPYHDVRGALGAVWRTRPESLRGILRNGREAADVELLYDRMVEIAGALNVGPVVERTSEDPRYAAARNTRVPRKIGSKLTLYDCINCDKCVPVCPNDANFAYSLEPQDLEYVNYTYDDGRLREAPGGRFVVEKDHQLANYADFCNECGNCDVFCPEDGGPFVEKPRFFSSLESWSADRDIGFYVRLGHQSTIWGRLGDGQEHLLQVDPRSGEIVFRSAGMEVDVNSETHKPANVRFPKTQAPSGAVLDMRAYHVLRTLLTGVTNPAQTNYINATRL